MPVDQAAEPPALWTERLQLRPVQAEDFDGWVRFFADPRATAHLGGTRSAALAWRHFTAMAGAWAIQGFGAFSLLDRSSGRWLGWSGPWHPPGWPAGEVGWCLLPEAGDRATPPKRRAVIDWVFEALAWPEMVHLIPPDNPASQRLAGRLGAPQQGLFTMPPPFAGEQVELWRQHRADWTARR